MRVLVVTSMYPAPAHPGLGGFVRDQVEALQALEGVEVEVFAIEPGPQRGAAILPCGVTLDRFSPRDRREARRARGLDPDGRYLLFPADPARAEKRHDRAVELARAAGDVELLTYRDLQPDQIPDTI